MNESTNRTRLDRLTDAVNRRAGFIKWVSIAVIGLNLLVLLHRLPIDTAVQAIESWIDGLGIWGPVVFGLLYVVAVVFVVPASALTLAAGALFGVFTGVVVVSLASTTGAALAFLISRYLARPRVTAYLKDFPKFEAIDRAVSEGSWKIVALLRLSPAVPFNLQNYLYGLTGIRFWPCVLTSWLTMLPGTFLYIYLGYLGWTGLEQAGSQRSRSHAEWAMLALGLLATVVVTLYITRLARRALREHVDLGRANAPTPPGPRRWPWGATLLAGLAVAAVIATVCVLSE
jgi:uncharacterized membrane protein YdjX (TVP38/TMEM64 family)